MDYFIGLDLSLNHYGIVALDQDGKVIRYGCMATGRAALAPVLSDSKGMAVYLKGRGSDEDKDVFEFRRRAIVRDSITNFVIRYLIQSDVNIYVAIEDYAYATANRAAYQIGEMGGVVRDKLCLLGCFLRLHNPSVLKLWATGKGRCLKREIVDESIKMGFSFLEKKALRKEIMKGDELEYMGLVTDLADSFFLAKMVEAEVKVRRGVWDMQFLSGRQRRVFLQVTKKRDVNLLDRPFINVEDVRVEDV